jgi:hypothetical protein
MNSDYLLAVVVLTSLVFLYIMYHIITGYSYYIYNKDVRKKMLKGKYPLVPGQLWLKYVACYNNGKVTMGFVQVENYTACGISKKVKVFTKLPKGTHPFPKKWSTQLVSQVYHISTIRKVSADNTI